jgi:hypothetical protein
MYSVTGIEMDSLFPVHGVTIYRGNTALLYLDLEAAVRTEGMLFHLQTMNPLKSIQITE